MLDRSINQLPEAFAAGHRPGDSPDAATQPMWLRTDSAGCSTRTAHGCRDRNVTFIAVARHSTQITAAIAAARVDAGRWQPAIGRPGQRRERSHVAEPADTVTATPAVTQHPESLRNSEDVCGEWVGDV